MNQLRWLLAIIISFSLLLTACGAEVGMTKDFVLNNE